MVFHYFLKMSQGIFCKYCTCIGKEFETITHAEAIYTDNRLLEDYSALDIDSQGPSSSTSVRHKGDDESNDSDSIDNDSHEPLK